MRKNTRLSKGQSFVEMAVVLPVIMLLALGGIEYVNLYVLGLRVASVGREASNLALRECRGMSDETQLTKCLQEIVDRVGKASNPILPNFLSPLDADGAPTAPHEGTIILTAWSTGELISVRGGHPDSGTIGGCESDQTDAYGSPKNMAHASKGVDRASKMTLTKLYEIFSSGADAAVSNDRFNSFVQEKGGYLFVAEVFYTYKPIVFDKTLFSEILPENGEIYQAGFF